MQNILLKPKEVARLFQVHPVTLRRWDREGKINAIRTPGGQRRYLKSEIEKIIGEQINDKENSKR